MTGDSSNQEESTFRFRRRTPGSFLIVPSSRDGRSVRCQGQLEARAAMVLTACPLVRRLTEQPLKIWYQYDPAMETGSVQLIASPIAGAKRQQGSLKVTYTIPDFLVELCDGNRFLIEVKPRRRLSRPRVQRHAEAAQIYCQHNGLTWRILTDDDLACEPLMTNLRKLVRYQSMVADEDSCAAMLELISDGMNVTDVLSRSSGNASGDWHILLHLIATGRITYDILHHELKLDTVLYRDEPALWNPFESVWARQVHSS